LVGSAMLFCGAVVDTGSLEKQVRWYKNRISRAVTVLNRKSNLSCRIVLESQDLNRSTTGNFNRCHILGLTQPPVHWVLRALFPWVKQLGLEDDHIQLVPRSRKHDVSTSTLPCLCGVVLH
jgi:hypothetical protein